MTWRELLADPRFPRTMAYDADLVMADNMGPHPLWLLESLCARLPLTPGSLVLDHGCGKALTSVFLARELGVRVVANDWWIEAADNLARLRAAGVADVVTPVHAEAHALPYGDGQFDAIVSVDSYHYFGTADLYVEEMVRLLAPGGRLGVVVPGLRTELDELPPPHLAEWWDWDFCAFHSPDWWRRLWARSGLVDVEVAEWLPGGHDLWVRWERLSQAYAAERGDPPYDRYPRLLEADTDGLLGFVLLVASPRPRG
jgi:cyclopropane fatty-acyl-phospholipid synthase-like methyltransferase